MFLIDHGPEQPAGFRLAAQSLDEQREALRIERPVEVAIRQRQQVVTCAHDANPRRARTQSRSTRRSRDIRTCTTLAALPDRSAICAGVRPSL